MEAAALVVLVALSVVSIIYAAPGGPWPTALPREQGSRLVIAIVPPGTDTSGYDIIVVPPGMETDAPGGYEAASYMGSGVLLHLLLNPAPVHVEEALGAPSNMSGVSRVIRDGNRTIIEYGAYGGEINPMAFRLVRLGIELLLNPGAAAAVAGGEAEPAPLPAVPHGPHASLLADIEKWLDDTRLLAIDFIRRGMMEAGAVYDRESGEWIYRGAPVRITYVAYPWSLPYTGIHIYVASRLRGAGFAVDIVNASAADYLSTMTSDPGQHAWHIVSVPLPIEAASEMDIVPMFYASWNHTALGGLMRPCVGRVYYNSSIDALVDAYRGASGVNRTRLLREITLMGVMEAVAIPLAYLPTRIYYRPGALPSRDTWAYLFTPWVPDVLAGKRVAVVSGSRSFIDGRTVFNPFNTMYHEPYLQILYSATLKPPIYPDPGYMAPLPLSIGNAYVYELMGTANAYLPVPSRLRWRPVTVERGAVVVRVNDPSGLADPVDGGARGLIYAKILLSVFLTYMAEEAGIASAPARLLGVEVDPGSGVAAFYYPRGTGMEEAMAATATYLASAPLPLGVLAYTLELAVNGSLSFAENYLAPRLTEDFLGHVDRLAGEGYTRYYWVVAPLGEPVVNETMWAGAVEEASSWAGEHGCIWVGNGAFYIASVNDTAVVLEPNPAYTGPRSPPEVVRQGDTGADLVAREENGVLYPYLMVHPRIAPPPALRYRYYTLYMPIHQGWPRTVGVEEMLSGRGWMIPLNDTLPFDEVLVAMAVEAWNGVLGIEYLRVRPQVEITGGDTVWCPGVCSINVSVVTGGEHYFLRATLYSYPDASNYVKRVGEKRLPSGYYGVETSLPIDLTGVAEGYYVLWVQLLGAAGPPLSNASIVVVADTEPPKLSVNVTATSNGLRVEWNASDIWRIRMVCVTVEGTGVNNTKYFYGEEKWYSDYLVVDLPPGNYRVTVTAYDYGNHSVTRIINATVPAPPALRQEGRDAVLLYIAYAMLAASAITLIYAWIRMGRRQ